MSGYWWQCEQDASHRLDSFQKGNGLPLVRFLYDLEKRGWDQTRLRIDCPNSHEAKMRITYGFPRRIDAQDYSVIHIVGLRFKNNGDYMPMIWETRSGNAPDHAFDFKYVNRHQEKGWDQAYGLARPAVFSRSELKKLFDLYGAVTGHEILSP